MCVMHAGDAGVLARATMQATLSGKGRLQIVRRIAEATNAAKQAPTMRAKAVKALSGVVKSDTSLLALPDVQHSINGALKVGDNNVLNLLSPLYIKCDGCHLLIQLIQSSSITRAGILMYQMNSLHARVSTQNAIGQ